MFIEFATSYAKYFFTKQLARYFNKFKISRAPELNPSKFFNPLVSSPWMLFEPNKYILYIPNIYFTKSLSIYLDDVHLKQTDKNEFQLSSEKRQSVRHTQNLKIRTAISTINYPIKSRLIPINGTCNFRDLGGYINKDKFSLKWGLLYRSDNLNKLGYVGKRQLNDLKIKTVIDFRGRSEALKSPDDLHSSINYIHIPIKQGKQEDNIKKALLKGMANQLNGSVIMMDIYHFFTSEAVEQFKKFFQIISNEKNYPLVFHCTAGKDRTGYVAALLMLLLRVDSKTVLHDYMLSNYYRHQENHKYAELGKFFMKREIIDDFLMVKPDYLNHALSVIKIKFGTVENYLAKALNVDKQCQEKIKKILLT